MLSLLKNYYEKYLRRQRKKKILAQCGNICYCPHCHDPLNDQAIWIGEGAVGPSYGPRAGIFRCRKCSGHSRWLFDVAPRPILDKEYMAKKDSHEKAQAQNDEPQETPSLA